MDAHEIHDWRGLSIKIEYGNAYHALGVQGPFAVSAVVTLRPSQRARARLIAKRSRRFTGISHGSSRHITYWGGP